jgi:hypothetical protein
VDITVPLEAVHSVPVDTSAVTVQGAPGWSYQVKADPPALTLEGPPEVPRPEALRIEPLTIPHSTQRQTREVHVQVPDGLTVSGNGSVRITVTPAPPPSGK